jgi:hypothetical protein
MLTALVATLAASVMAAQTPKKNSVPSFTAPVAKETDAQAFQTFIDKNRGKLVHLNVQMVPRFSRIGGKVQGKEDLWPRGSPKNRP